MKSTIIVALILGTLIAVIICAPMPAASSGEVICNRKGCIFPDKDYGPTVTPYTPTLKPRVRTLIVPPIWVNTTWFEELAKSSTTPGPQEDRSSTLSGEDDNDDNEEDNMV
ncbi:hypothetical protein RP20_CCG008721 [Aedes albopictus]|nr:hypothetical protein RP20_CCG008721 [Aedes albopictus]